MFDRGQVILVAGSIGIAAALYSAAAFSVEPVRNQQDGDRAMAEAFGSVDRNSGWCDDATTTPTNIWASPNVPDELKAPLGLLNRSYIRYLRVRAVDAVDTAVPMCVRLGSATDPATGRIALTCVGTGGAEQTNGFLIRGVGEGRSFQIERIPTDESPQLWVVSSAGSVRYCVEISWHQRG